MGSNAVAIFPRVRALLVVFCVPFVFPYFLHAQQSAHRKLYNRVAPSPSLKLSAEAAEELDFDFYIGRIVRSDGKYVVVNIASNSKISGRFPIYYGCDAGMRPTSILSNTGVSHKTCTSFKVERGEARVGDVVMAKFPAPDGKSK